MLARLDLLESQLTRIARAVALIGLAGLLLIAGVTVADVLGRWLFNAPLAGAMDFTQVAIIVVVAACFPSGVLTRQHITIRFVGERFGPRAVAWLDALGAFVLFAVLGGIAWQFVVYTNEIINENQHTWIIGLSYAPWWILGTALFIVTVALQGLVALVQFLRALYPAESRQEAH